jgi:hypothetical protein
MGTAAAIIGSAVIGAAASSSAASKSAKAQRKGIEASNALLQPFSQAGQAGLGGVQDFVNQGANFADTQAFKDITNQAKAGGQYGSGNRMTALTDYYATNFRPQRLQELGFLPQLGANASAQQASNILGGQQALGQTQAAGALGVGNSLNSGLNNLAFLGMYNQGQSAGVQSGVNSLLNKPGLF